MRNVIPIQSLYITRILLPTETKQDQAYELVYKPSIRQQTDDHMSHLVSKIISDRGTENVEVMERHASLFPQKRGTTKKTRNQPQGQGGLLERSNPVTYLLFIDQVGRQVYNYPLAL